MAQKNFIKKLSDTNIIRIKLSKILDEFWTKIKNLDGVESVAFTGDELTVSVEKSKIL
ncbi:hypothetical protein [Caldicellulosiruptor bescii]|uniref:hypothetical protein n=1 Tax=Caldicellulosiruptor bescii TaxID=31899 RepID=UPI00211C58E9|nr:hypothetical protein [Caldicellulosiruptor bescii]